MVGRFKGYYNKKGTAGYGVAANTALVMALLLVFVVDFIAIFVFDIFL
ncbi:MAG: phospholipid/cholesterol/gamma-HCH transport system permease protein [Maribacter sp.]